MSLENLATANSNGQAAVSKEDTDTYTMVCGVNCGHVGCMAEEDTDGD